MEDVVVFGFKDIGWLFVHAGYIIVPLLLGTGIFYCWASVKHALWALTWESKRKKRAESPVSPPKAPSKPKKKAPKAPRKPSRTVIDSYSDEYKLPQLPFS